MDRKTKSLYKSSHIVTNGLLQDFKEKLKCLKNHFLHKEGWKILDFWIIFSKVLWYFNHIWTTGSLLNIYASFWQPTKMCRHYLAILNYIGKNWKNGEMPIVRHIMIFSDWKFKKKWKKIWRLINVFLINAVYKLELTLITTGQ